MTDALPEVSHETTLKVVGKYLTFILREQSFGINLLSVREIIRLTHIIPVPQMPDYVTGVINLRGKVIPVIDLNRRLGYAVTTKTETACIVIVKCETGIKQIGLMVDGVEEVMPITAADIEEAPDFRVVSENQYVVGVAKVKNSLKILLDSDAIVAKGALDEISIHHSEALNA